ncbi:DEAD/DEAH box helicase [Bifidobacterium vansinderenii]|uniref:Helicase n=1 Tax=Bifidobacterium vansinderenii TaxID=1984871 RepID=A0A229VYW0_9BIFI|nr:DEAD/DEAH box helicase [Bifidobacterium vansinderenii]OXN00808.1 helicase [Bifidobacterium vansinderenii]
MNWRSDVYGRGAGGSGSFGSFGGSLSDDDGYYDDGYDDYAANIDGMNAAADADSPAYGHQADAIPEYELRSLGGTAFYRAYDVITSGRMHSLRCEVDADGDTVISALVHSNASGRDDYATHATIDETTHELVDSFCTCPAYGVYSTTCKHVIALIMQYNDHPQAFAQIGDPTQAKTHHTSRLLQLYMRQREHETAMHAHEQRLNLLKQVSALAESNGDMAGTDDSAGTTDMSGVSRRMPIGSVSLTPCLHPSNDGWRLKLRIRVPRNGIEYTVKNIRATLNAIQNGDYFYYGKRLGFVHTRDSFDERSRRLIDVLTQALAIRAALGVHESYDGYYRRKPVLNEMELIADEVVELLDVYLDSGECIDYVPVGSPSATSTSASVVSSSFREAVPVAVIDGDPDPGITVREDDSGDGYVIDHTTYFDLLVEGRNTAYVVVRQTAETRRPVFRKCSAQFVKDFDMLSILCNDADRGLFLNRDDLDMFSRTILPYLGTNVTVNEDGTTSTHGIPAELPSDLLRRKRLPCVIETYLDRDRDGISCDVQARYGDQRFHVFAGIAPGDVTRDPDVERLAVEAIRHYFPQPDDVVARIPESDDDAIYRLLTEGLPVLRGLGEVFSTPAFDGLTDAPRPTIRVGLSVASDLVRISPIADEIDPKDVPALLNSYRCKQRFHRLSNGAFVDMRDVDASAIDEVAADLGVSAASLDAGTLEVPAYEAYYLDHQVDDADKSASFTAYLDGLRVIDPAMYTVPASLADVLRPYQVEGFRWLNAVCDKGFGGILADEMGLGKTVQMLSLLVARRERGSAGEADDAGAGTGDAGDAGFGNAAAGNANTHPSLIVCPASLVYNWLAECGKFAPGLRAAAVAGTKAARRSMIEAAKRGDYDVIITSYDLLRRDVADYDGLDFDVMALDEAQYVKNHATKASRAVRSIHARHRFALTGTPIENRLSELWSIFDFLMPGMLGSYAHFRERFEMPILAGDENAQAKLQAFVGPFILRRLKADVLADLPDKIENVITVQLAGEQRRLYAALEQRLRDTLTRQKDKDFNESKIQVLAQLTRLRQVCCDPRLAFGERNEAVESVSESTVGGRTSSFVVDANDTATTEPAASKPEKGSRSTAGAVKPRKTTKLGSAKLDAIEELVSNCRDAGRKMLIFSQFTSYLDLIAERLRANGVDYDVITGATPKRTRLELVDAFNSDSTPVFLISLKAGNTGLNLTGACVVVHADPWWNAAAQNQATDRAHRIGQTQDVNVYQIVAKDTIEERILNLQRTKTDLAARFVDAASTGGNAIGALTKDDLLRLLG